MSDANLGDGPNGRLSEAEERFENYLRWHFNVVAEEGKGSVYIGLGIENAQRQLAAVVREHTERAWDEGCRAAEQFYKRTAIGTPGLDPINPPDNPYAARQEQSR